MEPVELGWLFDDAEVDELSLAVAAHLEEGFAVEVEAVPAYLKDGLVAVVEESEACGAVAEEAYLEVEDHAGAEGLVEDEGE